MQSLLSVVTFFLLSQSVVLPPPSQLPPLATTQLTRSLEASAGHQVHVWRDTPAINADGTINGYIEIPRGERRKYELDMSKNVRFIDREMPRDIGGYPVNYGIVPQTVSYDGDPFDILVLGPAITGGTFVRGVIVGLMHMEDEKGLDSKVVVSPVDGAGKPLHKLTTADQRRIGNYFKRYKRHEKAAGKFSKIPGWDSAAQGLAFVKMTNRFFKECRQHADRECQLTVE
ncbi:MAG TPA: inorganic diphosphatase [Vicinamibacterales bacterium]|nr:inorganic diphosphatase [Vicinamibacterales bacterium]